MSESNRKVGARREVTLAKAHKHGGRWHKEGGKIKAFPHTIERLEKAGKIAGSAGRSPS